MTAPRLASRKHILLTGAAGGIGSAFFRATASTYHFRLADRETTSLAGPSLKGIKSAHSMWLIWRRANRSAEI